MPEFAFWIRQAEERLAAALRKVDVPTATPAVERDAISARLRLAFPHAVNIAVLDYYVGFKHRPGEHILQVDVRHGDGTNTYVVKVADAKRLAREQTAWAQCGLISNPVFMALHACPPGATADELVAIAYQDAQKHIGVEETVWLESAVRDSVRFNRPTLESIISVLHNIYSQTGQLYRTSRLGPAGVGCIQTVPTSNGEFFKFDNTLDRWKVTVPHWVRQQSCAAFAVGSTSFLDPVDAFRYYDARLAQMPRPEELLPEVLRGLAHGDLHGRNSIVGIDEQEKANFPTLFDYESIHPDNLVGWDFVEMETELKIRIFDKIFPRAPLATWARQVQQFEATLNDRTRQCHDSRSWPGSQVAAESPVERLQAVLLAIRHEAFQVLGRPRAESLEWLREYYFLLACYGLTTVRYPNQTDHQRAAAYISAGVAVARLENMRAHAPDPTANLDALLNLVTPTYQIPLRFARQWTRGKTAKEHQDAEALLADLVKRYPAALHVRYEQAFNLIKQKRREETCARLEAIRTDFGDALDEDTWSLWGRCFKEEGDAFLQTGMQAAPGSAQEQSQFQEAEERYRHAIHKYEAAYAVAHGFFPGINVATLTFLCAALWKRLGRDDESQRLQQLADEKAKQLLETSRHWKALLTDDAVWMRATEAEAAMLCQQWSKAGERYRAAVRRPECAGHHPTSIGNQLCRILDGYHLLGQPVPLIELGDLTCLTPERNLEKKP